MNKFSLIIGCLLCAFLQGCWVVEEGEKVGTVIKVSQSGLFIKTYECSMIRGGMQDGSGSFGKEFNFTVQDRKLKDEILTALIQQKEIRIRYHREIVFFTSESDGYFADEILGNNS